jgi:hypothetical protein
VALLDEDASQLGARRHPKLAEDSDQVVLNRAGADKELRGDLLIPGAFPYEACDLRFLRGELGLRLDCAFAGSLTGRQQFDPRPLPKSLEAHGGEEVMSRPELVAGVASPALPPVQWSSGVRRRIDKTALF